MWNWTNLDVEPHDYQIYYVNNDLHHQYGICRWVTDISLYEMSQQQRARRNSFFLQARILFLLNAKHSKPFIITFKISDKN